MSSCSLSSYYYQGSLNIPRLLISRWLFPPGLWTRSQALTSRCRRAAQSNSSVLPRDFQRKSESLSKNNYFDDCFVERVRFFKLTLIVDVNVVLYVRFYMFCSNLDPLARHPSVYFSLLLLCQGVASLNKSKRYSLDFWNHEE